jgi:hypothetical protein
MAKFADARWLGVRILTLGCALASISWTVSVIPAFRERAIYEIPGERILAGEEFRAERLGELQRDLDGLTAGSLQPSALRDVVAIRVRLSEMALSSGDTQVAASRFDELETAVDESLAGNPTESFVWLTKYWLQHVRSGDIAAHLRFLGMSYLAGPNEGWIAVRRNPLALSVFALLPPELAEQVLTEFTGLVRSGLYSDAASILAGPGWPAREKLLGRLSQLEEADRRGFAYALDGKNLDGVVVPGVDEESLHSDSFHRRHHGEP